MMRSAPKFVFGVAWIVGVAWGLGSTRGAVPAAPAESQVLYLQTEFLPYTTDTDQVLPYRLGRELVRQAILMAARDEMGLATRDETLQEAVPQQAQVTWVMPVERALLTGKWQVKLLPAEQQGDVIWEKTYDFVVHGGKIYGDMVPKLESDTRGALLEGLRAAGLTGDKPPVQDPAPPGPEIEQWLGQVDMVLQFAAVRAAHEAIAAHGETPEWLGVLARGYAHLALLTNHYWNSTPEVYTARAWLYAQRLVTVSPSSDLALWHRAYAWALGGTLQHALEDLAELEARQAATAEAAASDTPAAPPAWSKLIKPYCMCDRAALRQLATDDAACRPWATLLRFALASFEREPQWMWDAMQELQPTCPAAYCAYSDLVYYGRYLALSRSGAAWAPMLFSRCVPTSVAQLAGLPAPVQQLVADQKPTRGWLSNWFSGRDGEEFGEPFSQVPMEIARLLRADSEQTAHGEPSWSALASLLEEEQFVQIAHYFGDAVNATEYPLADEVDRLLPLIKNHRYALFIDGLRYYYDRDVVQQAKLYGGIRVVDPRMNLWPMFTTMANIPDAQGQGLGTVAIDNAHRNFTLQGMREYLAGYTMRSKPEDEAYMSMLANEMHEVAPHADVAIYYAITFTKEPTIEQLKTWEDQLKEHPVSFSALAFHYWKLKDWDAAVRCCKRSLASVPTSDATTLLAELYKQRKDYDNWERTLLDYLQTDDLGLKHQGVQSVLARGYATRGQWAKAKPIAQKCAATWSFTGLYLASEICEGLAEWEASEQYMRDLCEGYPTSAAYLWYFWCRRTGRGDVAAARKMADTYFAAPHHETRERAIYEGVFHLLNDDAAQGLVAYRKALSPRPSFSCTYMVAQLARAAGDEKLRADVLSTMRKASVEYAEGEDMIEPEVLALGMAIIQLLESGDASDERLSRLDELLGAVGALERSAYAYYVGKELEALGKQAEAEQYWRRCLQTPGHDLPAATLAGYALAKLHGTSRPDADALDADDLWPPLSAAQPEP
ncbi:MAG: hypothetical protein GXY58_12290 [Planctomycetaceae bacterium]|nr:hypothetical protein [Planctomycetaceae bacterium]